MQGSKSVLENAVENKKCWELEVELESKTFKKGSQSRSWSRIISVRFVSRNFDTFKE